MAASQRGLGRGLDALLKGVGTEAKEADVKNIPLSSIRPNPHQPRREFKQESLEELAQSIKSQGVLQPILVRPLVDDDEHSYELIAGERRWRATRLAGLRSIPALVKDLSDEDSLTIAIIENLQREDLNPMDEAQGLYQLQQRLNLNQDALAQRIGKSRPALANALRLLQLPDSIQDDLRTGRLTAGHARSLLAIDDPQTQISLRDRILAHGFSVREVEAQVSYWKDNGQLPDSGERMVSTPARTAPSKPPTDLDPDLAHIRDSLTEALQIKVGVSGSMSKGRLILSFSSQEQLDGIVAKLQG